VCKTSTGGGHHSFMGEHESAICWGKVPEGKRERVNISDIRCRNFGDFKKRVMRFLFFCQWGGLSSEEERGLKDVIEATSSTKTKKQ